MHFAKNPQIFPFKETNNWNTLPVWWWLFI